jgi:hypothetical protein
MPKRMAVPGMNRYCLLMRDGNRKPLDGKDIWNQGRISWCQVRHNPLLPWSRAGRKDWHQKKRVIGQKHGHEPISSHGPVRRRETMKG